MNSHEILLRKFCFAYDDDDDDRHNRVHHSFPRHRIVAVLISSASVGALGLMGEYSTGLKCLFSQRIKFNVNGIASYQ